MADPISWASASAASNWASAVPTISGTTSTPAMLVIDPLGGVFQDSVSRASQLVQTGSHRSWMCWQRSQTHCGPRGADSDFASHPLTSASDPPASRSIAAMMARARASGSDRATLPMAARAAEKSPAAMLSSASISFVSRWPGWILSILRSRLIRRAGDSPGSISAIAEAMSG